MKSHDLEIFDFSYVMSDSGERLSRGDTKVDFTVDEEEGPLNPFRDKKERQ